MLYELMIEGRVRERPSYRTGIYCRKLSSDIYWHEQILRRDAPAGLVEFPDGARLARDLFKIVSPRHHFDVQQWRDPLPGLVDLARIGANYLERLGRLFREKRARAALRKPWRDGHAAARIGQARRLLFICYGNINRSALAERYFHSLPASRRVEAISAGFHETEGRPADPVMVEVAAASGIDLRDWSSRKVTRDMIDASDVVLVMEDRHYRQIATLFPDAAERTFLLGMAADARGEGEIADPYGRPRPIYERCAGQVRSGVDAIAGLLRHASGQG
jgi:protein-tyrosine-phosphatase